MEARKAGRVAILLLTMALLLPVGGEAAAATVSIRLCAAEGTLDLGEAAVDVWGFVRKGGSCDGEDVLGQVPGPVIQAREGDVVSITLGNGLTQEVSLVFPGQDVAPDTVGIPPGGERTYTFTASRPGTFVYESGVNPQIQVPMGLYGALIVRPAGSGGAYGTAASDYEVESLFVLSEIDPALNADPEGFNPARYAPAYWLINGRPFPRAAQVFAAPGKRVLLRYVNAGLQHHTMTVLGARPVVVARDAYPLGFPAGAVAETIPAGATADLVAAVPAAAVGGSTIPVYSRQLAVTNADDYPGGMLTFVRAADLYVSILWNGRVLGPTYADEDILAFRGSNVVWRGKGVEDFSLLFDGSDVGADTLDVDAFVVVDEDTILMSFDTDFSIGGIGTFDDSDVLRFEATSLGKKTAGTFSMCFDGSDVGLATADEDVDALEVLPDGRLLVSTSGAAAVPGVSLAQDEDLLAFTPSAPADPPCPGEATAGAWALRFDGSDVGLATTGGEDVDGVSVAENGDMYLSTRGGFSVPGLAGAGEDVFVCTPTSLGAVTRCFLSPALALDGSRFGLTNRGVDGVGVG